MKTIAVSIDEPTLEHLDRLAQAALKGRRGRAATDAVGKHPKIVRAALHEFIARREQSERETRERRILAANRKRLDREAAALVAEQAKP